MNAIEILEQDHKIVDTLFQRIEDTPPSEHKAIFVRIRGEIETHAHVEEKIFYPAVRRKGDKELKATVLEGLEEHSQIKKILNEIGRSRKDEIREAKLKVLIEDTRHHVKEEEGEMFPKVEDQFSDEELEKLGTRIENEKREFQRANDITPENREEYKGLFQTLRETAKQVASAVFSGDSGSGKSREPNRKGSPSSPEKGRSNAKTAKRSAPPKKSTSSPRSRAASVDRT